MATLTCTITTIPILIAAICTIKTTTVMITILAKVHTLLNNMQKIGERLGACSCNRGIPLRQYPLIVAAFGAACSMIQSMIAISIFQEFEPVWHQQVSEDSQL